MKKVLILSDTKAGHFNQSLAVAEAIKSLDSIEEIYVEVKVKKIWKYFLRILLNSMIGRKLFQNKRSLKMIHFFYEGYEWNERPDIIISSGKDTSLLNAALSLMYGSTNFFIGNPKKLDHHLFSAVITVLDQGFDNQIVLDIAPTQSYKHDLIEFSKTYNLDPQCKYATLLIGGDGSGYYYNEEDIEQLIAFVNATTDKIKWLVTTSRRTSKVYEEKMEKEMRAECFIAFNKNPQKVVAGFLGLSNVVFVTEESASMVSEAVASKNPVVTLIPNYHDTDKSYGKILEKFKEKRCIQRMDISLLDSNSLYSDKFVPLDRTSVDEIAQKLSNIIG